MTNAHIFVGIAPDLHGPRLRRSIMPRLIMGSIFVALGARYKATFQHRLSLPDSRKVASPFPSEISRPNHFHKRIFFTPVVVSRGSIPVPSQPYGSTNE